MKIFGIAGWSGSGKTTLLVRLIPELTARGLKVSTIKHAHHGFDFDKPGKDSWEHRTAGATEVMITSDNRWALMRELRDEAEPTLAECAAHMSDVDLLLVEGFKHESHDKIEVSREATGKALLQPDDPHIVAVASDAGLPEVSVPVIHIDDIKSIANFILDYTGLGSNAGAS
ncbi:MAG: molybdopterin-guanine dinucleotide biosynthesis protein B [Alphaproteobacteria bacterium]|jgi:molybdopterin-guanine dinucleotide biosynthesis adapter protein|nr:molybdopterin-guanine dinucleotide biosynthesis protein B [Alphaproteobacteria bacterium]MBT4083195.1 molybdopterin-guanine dinucleotide biosynthesis protein B [Alphaproteobacteria bacterium]MBT4546261.1 molybdopterin-guanine dinucleotide biosynthesis protein B [Alphaproteobacteria bacterium]MBT6385265.1 molybdopterin-guanine dinucleotide biosynthesis protein B [Alphaproteobacteria bacterium]MBT7747778.1 molybdopterin-guanine dinucleotide biosynthesis protein B [Alphaproteobacteria bacterium